MNCHATTKSGSKCKRKTDHQYCRQHERQNEVLSGDGLYSDAKDFIKRRITALKEGPAAKPTSRLQSILDRTTDNKVIKLELGKKSIRPLVHKALDAVSLGEFSRRQKKLDYEKIYHNFLIATLEDGTKVKIEKDEVIKARPVTQADYTNSIYEIDMKGKDLNLQEMFKTASEGNEKDFFRYRASSANCQNFTRDMIVKNGLLPDGAAEYLKLQNAHHLISAVPTGTHVANLITDSAAVADRLIHGDGINRH